MKPERFEQILERRKQLMTAVLSSKAKEYASDVDRLQNFYDASLLLYPVEQEGDRGARSLAALLFMTKHVVSVFQMVKSGSGYTREQWDEKLGDLINYVVLLEATLEDDGRIVFEAKS
jgi:hypothetical protein